MSGQHGSGLVARLLHRREDPFDGPDLDLQDDGSAVTAETLVPLPAFPVLGPRPYVPSPLGLFQVPDPGAQADLGPCTIWRDTVRDHFVRQERTHGTLTAGPPWYVQWARVYRQRTGLVSVREPDFALWRFDGLVDDIVEQAIAAVDAEDAVVAALTEDVPAGECSDDGQGEAA
jgi:hypothetical protein